MADSDIPRRRFTLLDAMVLVAATAPALAAWRAIHPEVQGNDEEIAGISLLLAAWSWAALFLRRGPFGAKGRRPACGPGDAACMAACVAITLVIIFFLVGILKRSLGGGSPLQITLAPTISPLAVAPAVLASWLATAAVGQWRREVDWLGWAGRVLGVGWIVILFALGVVL